jgi:ABC-type multidrug transport system ATPase subunit
LGFFTSLGAGKSTLISTLTQDAFYGSAFGTVSLNGIPMSDRLFKRYCYVVKQQDTNWPYLTARETLTYAAELYDLVGDKESAEVLVQDLIQKTGLLRCSDLKVESLSGGQQRRLSIAVALLKKPAVLFLDEPTSGLDAASAQHIMREITRVAKEERLIIICTIHQPSTKVYNGFDQLMIMSKGRQAFVGNATAAAAYFDSIGYALPPATNPAEHFLDLVNADFSSSEEVDAILDTWETRNSPDPLLLPQSTTADDYSMSDNMKGMSHSLVRETKVMFRRHTTLIVRDPILYAGRIVCFLVVNCVFGIAYIAARDYTQDQAGNKLWVSAWYIGTSKNLRYSLVG